MDLSLPTDSTEDRLDKGEGNEAGGLGVDEEVEFLC
jgi:hypothetical protein